jgi:hypothetical protein
MKRLANESNPLMFPVLLNWYDRRKRLHFWTNIAYPATLYCKAFYSIFSGCYPVKGE